MPKKYLGMSGNSLNWAISTVAGCDFLLFGYGMLNKKSDNTLLPFQRVVACHAMRAH